jgi:hypothetical protein
MSYHTFDSLNLKNNLRPRYFNVLIINVLCAIIFASMAACGSEKDETAPPIPNISNIKVPMRLERFERDLFGADTLRWKESMDMLAAKYPQVLPYFVREVLSSPATQAIPPDSLLLGFAAFRPVRQINDSCQARFGDLNVEMSGLESVFKFYKYYFPELPTPKVVTAVTEYTGDVMMVNDSILMIGLDLFLGPKYSGYNPDDFPGYLTRQFDSPYLPAKVAVKLADDLVPPAKTNHILDEMIRNGKVLYIAECLAAQQPKEDLIGYSPDQWQACLANEQTGWARILDLQLLHQPLNQKNIKLVRVGPSTDLVFSETPGELGNWYGWRIVRAYMKRYPNTKIVDLLALEDAQKLLEKARYKPRDMR